MNPIRIRKQLDSETLHLPELRPLLGQTVEIIVVPAASPPGLIRPGTGDWEEFDRLARSLGDYDFEVRALQDEIDLKDMNDLNNALP